MRALKDHEHKAHEVSAWSSTPQFDRASVSCAVSVIGSICLRSKSILRLQEEPDVDVAVDGHLKNALDQLGDLDTTKPKLLWALGEELAAEFITHALLVRSVAIPHHEKVVIASVSRAKDLVQNLSGVLVEEPEPIKMAAFFPQLSKQAAAKMKELGAKLKEEQGLELDPALKSTADEILLRSRQQLLKWGLSKFLTFESIRLPTPAGKQLRKSLKVLWGKTSATKISRSTWAPMWMRWRASSPWTVPLHRKRFGRRRT